MTIVLILLSLLVIGNLITAINNAQRNDQRKADHLKQYEEQCKSYEQRKAEEANARAKQDKLWQDRRDQSFN